MKTDKKYQLSYYKDINIALFEWENELQPGTITESENDNVIVKGFDTYEEIEQYIIDNQIITPDGSKI